MHRVNIYLDDALWQKVENSAGNKGISWSSEIIAVLERAYAERDRDEGQAESPDYDEILSKIRAEAEEFIAAAGQTGKEYTLYEISGFFASIAMAENNRLNALKPRIGKAFRSMVDNGVIQGLEPVYSGGRQKRRNNAALYRLKEV